ncbi:MAG: TetR/AcrR family transcriptional regulator [Oscillospiraceae bacterium]|nr:TetR/AcrR family transcriptional regulator [Oscillospiraceae bacterium]
MLRDKELHHESIISAATAEFLAYGFKDASMRRIAAAAGMSVSGLYRHFADKEEMFSALVEPVVLGLMELYHREEGAQQQALSVGDLSAWECGRDAALLTAYIYDHLDAFRLIICKSQGTKYESFLHDLAVLEEETTLSFMDLLRRQGVKLNDFRRKEFHLLTTTNIDAIFQTVHHNFTREDAMHYAETIDRCFSRAWKEFFGY